MVEKMQIEPLQLLFVTFEFIHDTFQKGVDVTELPDLQLQLRRKYHFVLKLLFLPKPGGESRLIQHLSNPAFH